jgi:UDP-glucuronate 4-epimerase
VTRHQYSGVVVVTGAAGFIGSHLCERLLAQGNQVVGLDNFDPHYARDLKERNLAACRGYEAFQLVEGDVRSASDLDRAIALAGNPSASLVHLAALAGVRPSVLEPERFYDVNVMGTLSVLQACRRQGLERIVVASSSSVYGDGADRPSVEADPCDRPLSPYAASKRACELIAHSSSHLSGAAITCLRLFTVYGPRQRPDLAIHKFVAAIVAGRPVEMFGSGNTARDYTFVTDVVDGMVAAIEQQRGKFKPTEAFRTYNLGGGRATTLTELVGLVAASLGQSGTIVRRPTQAGDVSRTLADISAARRDLGYRPQVEIRQGLERFITWWRESNPSDQVAVGKRGMPATV